MNKLWVIIIHKMCLTIRNAAPQFDFGQQYFQMQQISRMPGIPPFPGMLQMPSMPQIQSLPPIPSVSYFSSFGSNPSSVHEINARRSYHHRHKIDNKDSTEDEYDDSSDVSGECRCSCNKCDRPKPCCIPVCEQCNMIGVNQGGVMLVPYAYPVFLTHPPNKQVTTQSPHNTENELNDKKSKLNQKEDVIRSIINKVEREESHDNENNELDDADMRLMKIIRIVQLATKETNTIIPSAETPTTITALMKTTSTSVTTTTTTTTPITTTTTTTTTTPATTTTTTTIPVTTKAQKTKHKKRKRTATTTTTTINTTPATTPELKENTTTITDIPTTKTFQVGPTTPSNLVYDDVLFKTVRQDNKHHKYILTSMRRMKENYLPKYGVVPIPDDVAERLLQRIRSMRSGSAKSRMVTPETFFPEDIRHRHHIPLNSRIRRYQEIYS